MKRLDINKELVKMHDTTDKENLNGFLEILKHFYLDNKSNKRIMNNLKEKNRTEQENYLDKYFDLNNQRRAFFEISVDPKYDIAYSRYLEILRYSYGDSDVLFKHKNVLREYDTFTSGKITIDNQPQKLFKFLLKHGVSKQNIEYITSAKASDRNFICISRNPIDYLFNTTNQNFSSCMDLHSVYEGGFYMGTGGVILDPNRFIVFLTNGKLKRHILQDVTFKHFSYINRSWGLIVTDKTNEEKLTFVRWYPNKPFNIEKMLTEHLEYKTIDINNVIDSDKTITSLFPYELPKFINNEYSHIYCDYYGYTFKDQEKDCIQYTNYRYEIEGSCITFINYTEGFNNIEEFEDLEYNYEYHCVGCDRGLQRHDAYMYEHDPYCSDCFREFAFICNSCDGTFLLEEAYDGQISGMHCKKCQAKYFVECSNNDCNMSLHKRQSEIYYKYGDYTKKANPYCRRCHNNIRDLTKEKNKWRCIYRNSVYDLINGNYEKQKDKVKKWNPYRVTENNATWVNAV